MTGKAGNRLFITVLAMTCLVVAVIRIITGDIGSAYSIYFRSLINRRIPAVVTGDAPFLLAGLEVTTAVKNK